MAQGIAFDLDKLDRLSEELVRRVDALLGAAVDAVENGAAKASVSISFDVEADEEGGLVGRFTVKHQATEKGIWNPSRSGQMRLIER